VLIENIYFMTIMLIETWFEKILKCHYNILKKISFYQNVFLSKCIFIKMYFFYKNVYLSKCIFFIKMYIYQNVFLSKCIFIKLYFYQNGFHKNVFLSFYCNIVSKNIMCDVSLKLNKDVCFSVSV
jgi:hypothetical protein